MPSVHGRTSRSFQHKMKMIRIEKIQPGQEREVGKILFDTDPYIYPAAFGTREYAGEIFPELFKLKKSAFYADNIIVASEKNNILGCIVIIANNNPDNSNYGEIKVKPEIKESFMDVSNRYISKLPSYLDNCSEAVYIPCLCVKEEARGKGVGTQLLKYIKQQYPDKVIILHVLEDNTKAIKLYLSLGFEIIEKHLDGYSYNSLPPKCCEMHRKASLN